MPVKPPRSSLPRTHKMAELLFEHLCNSSSAVANRVSDDQNGWDMIVEFPQTTTTRPPDTARPAITCLVQIKSSVRLTASYKLKLSNALRFARHSLPCFVVKAEFEEDGKTLDSWYLQHFWHGQIEATLRSVREAHVKEGVSLNRRTISFKFDPSERVGPDILIETLLKMVERVPSYASAKSTFAEKVGYEKGSGVGTFSVRGEDAMLTLIDTMTGFADGVGVENFILTPARFGILEPAPIEGPISARLTARVKPIATCTVVLFSADRSQQISLSGEVYTPSIPNLPKNLRRMRIHTSVFDMAISPFCDVKTAEGDVKSSFDFDASYTLPDLCDKVTAFSWLQKGSVEFEVWLDGKQALAGHLSASMPTAPSWAALAFVLKSLRDFVPAAQQPNELMFRVSDFSDMKLLVELVAMLRAEDATIEFAAAGPVKGLRSIKHYIMPVCFDIGPVTYFGICRYDIFALEEKSGQIRIKLRNGTLISKAVLRGAMGENIDFVAAEIKMAESVYGIGRSDTLFQMPDLSVFQ